jgi:dTDP-4-amino-4,6-dideoxygalactose transaminase
VDLIPFNKPSLAGAEHQYIQQALSNLHISGNGTFTKKCQALLEAALGGSRVLLTTSCTDALEMAAILLDVGPGDEIIVPSFTFVSTANAFVLRGARPVFVDVRSDTANLDERLLEAAITPRTKAIVVVHYAGIACEMATILELASRRGIPVVEDNAHGLFGKYRERWLGTLGVLGTQSFHETKNFSCGEGGALVINDSRFIQRAEIVLEKGTNRSRYFRGEVDKYTWCDIGSSFLPSDLLAAFLLAQLEKRDTIQPSRKKTWNTYARELLDWARSNDVALPTVPVGCEHPHHLFYAVLPSLDARQALIKHLDARGVNAVFHYQPLHLSDMGRRFGGAPGQCPVTEHLGDCLVRFPLYNRMTEAEVGRVIEAVREFRV